ncbi:MAG: nuclear transport factor 2 family protein, partial [Actinobacteria bacterium]|nr:nuclear transport factor 2 family protein [Actinomycetota bacterium]
VVHRYCRGIDRRDFGIVRACFHPDATDRHGAEPRSLDDFVAWVDRLTARYRMTQHLIAGVVVDLAGDVAAAESNGVAVHRSDDPSPHLNLVTGFRYLDRFERRDGMWAITKRTGVASWSLPITADRWWDAPADHVAGRRDHHDPLYALLGSLGADL